MRPLLFILGPTASGKSALGLALAEKFGGAIFNCDSMQTYQRMDIGTAKPTPEERARVPHFLFDILKPGEVLTAGDYRRAALEILTKELIRAPGFAVGGSGFYVQALEKGMFDLPKPDPAVEAKVRARVAELGSVAAHAELTKLDPDTGEELNPNDAYRITRALIVIADGGRKLSELKKEFKPLPLPFGHLKLGLAPSREELLPRIEARTAKMLKEGLLDEVEALLKDGFQEWPALQSVGYKECVEVLNGSLKANALHARIVEKTIQLAKKQRTWFKRDAGTRWLDPLKPLPEATEIVARFLDSHP